uniref:Calmodulin n=1 Tax=Macrostomum lignano TaxID=282301 RepID=A0A1I8GC76_9PLAT
LGAAIILPRRNGGRAALLSRKLTESQLAEIRESFALFDKNGDGSISAEELGEVMKTLGQFPNADELQDMMRQVDEDGDGTIDFNEFVHMMSERMLQDEENTTRKERQMKRAFAVFDKDGNGLIDSQELKRVMESLGEKLTDQEIDEMMREADKNGDGFVDYAEFAELLSGAQT